MARIGFGYDVHRYKEGRPCILGGVDFGCSYGPDGHSDADCVTHALMDALLGAAALGDIGTLFPDTEEKYRGASSILLLSAVGRLLIREGYEVENCDITVCCEAPKISPRSIEMRLALSEALGIDISEVSVKATTEEGMGFTGRGEGVKCYAVCMLNRKESDG